MYKEVLGRLEVGYARLDRHQQHTFMYIACFLKGRDKDLVKDVLNDIGLYSECGITDLINKFLITINIVDCVWMHDLLQQMCWEILHKESQHSNRKQFAIKNRQDVVDVFSSTPEESRSIEIINQEPNKAEGDDCIYDPYCFSKLRKLKFLRISNIHFPQGLSYLSNDLRIMEWYGCSLKSLPSMFEPKHIYELEMCYSQLETLWEKKMDLPNLRSIDLSFSKDLTKIPDLTSTPSLVKLNLQGCTTLKELHVSVLSHKRLQYINLSGCTHLQSLGRSNIEMEALVALILSGCSNLEHLPEFGHHMKCLEHLYVDGTKINKLPESLGEVCNLRNLDASETCIDEIPLSIHRLKRLRLLRVHRCRISSQIRGIKMEMLPSGLRELDLSYCNLSVVPDCIGLLHRLVNLDLSGNDFVSLPANISLLSSLRMLSLNNCKRLQSLPKLSLVNEDTLYGLQMRFNYIISEEEVDVSKFNAPSDNTSPIVSCLNCPKVAENENGGHLAERILNSYLQLRTRCWITPEAVFEIVGAGSIIPSGFKLQRSNESLIPEGPWIGVVICAVVSLQQNQLDSAVESKYIITANIHVGDKHWRIPIRVHFLPAGLKNQLVFYWTRGGDLQRTVDSSQKKEFKFSFSMEPRDCKLKVTKFGVCFIHERDIMQLRNLSGSTTKLVQFVFKNTILFPSDLLRHMRACEAVAFLFSCHSSINYDLRRSLKFIFGYGEKQYTLHDVHSIVKRLMEINQEVLSECKEEWSHTDIFPLIYDYYGIVYGTSVLYNEFLRLLKDASDSWLSVKLALEQIVSKSRTENDYSYKEMLEQLNDIQATKSITFCDNIITSFAFLCMRIVSFSKHLNGKLKDIKNCKSMITLAKASSITITCLLSVLATYMCTNELSLMMKNASSYSLWLGLMCSFVGKSSLQNFVKRIHGRKLRIRELSSIAVIVQELKMKMAHFASFTCQNETEMMIVINKVQKMVDNVSVTIEDMQRYAHLYRLDIREAGITLNQSIVECNNLQLPFSGVQFMPHNEGQQCQNPVNEATTVLYQAILSLIQTDLHRYIRACEKVDDSSLFSRHSIIHYNTRRIIEVMWDAGPIGSGEGAKSLNEIHNAITCLHTINQEAFKVLSKCKEEWRHHPELFHLVYDYHKICLQISQLYNVFVGLLEGPCDSQLSVILRWKEIVVNFEQDDNYWNYTDTVHFNDDGKLKLSGEFVKSLAYTCKQVVAFTRHLDEQIQEVKSVKVLAKVSHGLIAGVFSVMAAYMTDCKPFQWMEEKTLSYAWLHLIRSFSWNSPLRKIKWFFIKDFLDVNSLLRDLNYNYFADKEDMMILINTAGMEIHKLSMTIEEMSRHAHEYSDDIIKAGISLELTSDDHNHMLGIKRKRTVDNI